MLGGFVPAAVNFVNAFNNCDALAGVNDRLIVGVGAPWGGTYVENQPARRCLVMPDWAHVFQGNHFQNGLTPANHCTLGHTWHHQSFNRRLGNHFFLWPAKFVLHTGEFHPPSEYIELLHQIENSPAAVIGFMVVHHILPGQLGNQTRNTCFSGHATEGS